MFGRAQKGPPPQEETIQTEWLASALSTGTDPGTTARDAMMSHLKITADTIHARPKGPLSVDEAGDNTTTRGSIDAGMTGFEGRSRDPNHPKEPRHATGHEVSVLLARD